jgi:copper chaperone CopZ
MPHRPLHAPSRIRIPHVPPRLAVILAVAAWGLFARTPVALAQGPGGASPVRPGAVTALVVPVQGMTCALCTRGVESSIKLLDVVQGASADLSTGLVRVQAAEGRSLNIKDVKDRVQKAGFKVGGECDVEAVGRFTLGTDGLITFRIPGTAYSFQVLEGTELKSLFKADARLRGDYFVAFRLHDHPRWKPSAISITRAESRGAPAVAAGR